MLTQQEAAAHVEVCGSGAAAAGRKLWGADAQALESRVHENCHPIPLDTAVHQPGEKRPPET